MVVLDLFGLSPVEYRPFLQSYRQQLARVKRLFLYHSHLQEEELTGQLNGLKGLETGLSLQLWPAHPLETVTEKDEASMLNRLISFLKEDSERPERQDAVVFVPASSPIRRFSSHLG